MKGCCDEQIQIRCASHSSTNTQRTRRRRRISPHHLGACQGQQPTQAGCTYAVVTTDEPYSIRQTDVCMSGRVTSASKSYIRSYVREQPETVQQLVYVEARLANGSCTANSDNRQCKLWLRKLAVCCPVLQAQNAFPNMICWATVQHSAWLLLY